MRDTDLVYLLKLLLERKPVTKRYLSVFIQIFVQVRDFRKPLYIIRKKSHDNQIEEDNVAMIDFLGDDDCLVLLL